MTWQGKRRKQLPGNWGSIRKQVLVRDGYRCTWLNLNEPHGEAHGAGHLPVTYPRCPAQASEVHHINGPTDHRRESLRSICAYHHNEETQREAKAAQAKVSRRRPVAKHPGLT